MDKAHYQTTRNALQRSPGGRQRFEAAVVRLPAEDVTDLAFARIAKQEDGSCVFLDPQRLCSLQKAYGSQILCNTCAIFPRSSARFGDVLETTATASCPEVARLLLLAEDSMVLEELEPSRAGRTLELQVARRDEPDPYVAALDLVREVMLGLLRLTDLPFPNRQFLTLYLGERTRATFHQEAHPDAIAQLNHELEGWSQPGRFQALAEMYDQLTAEAPDAPVAARVLLELLVPLLPSVAGTQLHTWIVEVCMGRHDAPPTTIHLDVPSFYARHRERVALLTPETTALLDRALTNYAQNYWFKEWYLSSPDLFIHGRRLLIRAALLRLFLLGHPDFPAAASDPDRFRLLIVALFYRFVRAIEHNSTLLVGIEEQLDRQGVRTLAHLVFLIQI